MRRLLATAAAAVLLTACSATSTGNGPTSSTTSSSATSSSASSSSPGTGSAPTAEQTAWAGQVCTDAGRLRTSIQGLAAAAASGGGDVSTKLSAQLATIKASATALVDTVSAVPPGSESDPDVTAVQSSAGQLRASIDTLDKAVNGVQGTSGVGAVQAVAAVVTAASGSLKAVGATTQAISKAAKNSKGTMAQAFAANASCTALKP